MPAKSSYMGYSLIIFLFVIFALHQRTSTHTIVKRFGAAQSLLVSDSGVATQESIDVEKPSREQNATALGKDIAANATATSQSEVNSTSKNGPGVDEVQHGQKSNMFASNSVVDAPESKAREIIQISMLFGNHRGVNDEVFERSLDTHLSYGERWGYETHVLRHQLSGRNDDDFGDLVFSKPLYMLSFLITELTKPEEERAKWVL